MDENLKSLFLHLWSIRDHPIETQDKYGHVMCRLQCLHATINNKENYKDTFFYDTCSDISDMISFEQRKNTWIYHTLIQFFTSSISYHTVNM